MFRLPAKFLNTNIRMCKDYTIYKANKYYIYSLSLFIGQTKSRSPECVTKDSNL